MLDAKQRRFTRTHPLHVDQYGGVVRIVSNDSPFTLRNTKMPILGYRWQVDTNEVEEHHYTLDGRWDMAAGQVSGYDLWDADLSTIKPLVVEKSSVLEDWFPAYIPDTDTDDDYLALAEELAQQEEYEAIANDEDYKDYEGDPDAPMGPSRYTGRNI